MNTEDQFGRIVPPGRLWDAPTWLISLLAADSHRLVVGEIGTAERADYSVLAGLAELGPISQSALGRRLAMDRSDVSGVLDRLEADGLVARSPDPAHGSRKLSQLTEEGRARLDRLDAGVRAAQHSLVGALGPDESARLLDLLQRLVEHHRGLRR
ncbi:MAG: MarR family transcriptional regulator [Rhodococcus sp.]|uniref:MarR family winged helix-turn-helix transcriptional regulator n=1 Tax=Rhodococcus TaxID=1827 RepID=UPI0016A7CB82|nr:MULTISPECIES: MarR family transcriptional regulator [Rhodococcus]NLV78088.1 MarR family transcriptional regulator [Rhodococcus sp. (in: high G+C Gram-positive bacteria)]